MRALKILVAVMGVLIVVGTATLAVLLVRRAGGDAVPSAAAPSTSALLRQLDEPSGTVIAAIALNADRLAIHLRGGGPDRVVLVDPRNGATVARVSRGEFRRAVDRLRCDLEPLRFSLYARLADDGIRVAGVGGAKRDLGPALD